MEYPELRENILKNILYRYAKNTLVSMKQKTISTVYDFCPFPAEYDEKTDEMNINCGDSIVFKYKFIWVDRYNEKFKRMNYLVKDII